MAEEAKKEAEEQAERERIAHEEHLALEKKKLEEAAQTEAHCIKHEEE